MSSLRERWPALRVISTRQTQASLGGAPMGRYAKERPDTAATHAFLESLDPVEAFMRGEAADTTRPARVREGFEQTLREIALYREDAVGLHIVVPTETFEDGMTIDDPDRPIELRWLGRANTDGDAVAWLPRQRVVITGDLVVLPIPFGYGSYPADWIDALGRIRTLEFSVLVPGHGAPQRDAACVDRLVGLIGDMRTQMATLAPDREMEEARSALDMRSQRELFVGDDPWLALWFDQYWTYPFAESLWKEARGVPITQGTG